MAFPQGDDRRAPRKSKEKAKVKIILQQVASGELDALAALQPLKALLGVSDRKYELIFEFSIGRRTLQSVLNEVGAALISQSMLSEAVDSDSAVSNVKRRLLSPSFGSNLEEDVMKIKEYLGVAKDKVLEILETLTRIRGRGRCIQKINGTREGRLRMHGVVRYRAPGGL